MRFKTFMESNTKLISNDEVYSLVQRIHRNPDDFVDGDLAKRLDKYKFYILKTIPISDLDLNEWDVKDYLVDELSDMIKKNSTYPPIVVTHNMSIIDGIHRANALHELGHKEINAYVGVRKK
jgi:hypothetical protein